MEPSERVKQHMADSWSRYREFIIGLNGLQGEVLAAHLAIEAEIELGLRRMLHHPDRVLVDGGYMMKLRLLQAVWPSTAPIDGSHFSFMILLNKARNAIAHVGTRDRFPAAFEKLAHCASTELESDEDWLEDPTEAIRGTTMRICGYIVGLTSGSDGEAVKLSFPTPSTASPGAPAGP